MKHAVKIIAALAVACALLAGGYLAGQKVQISSILSAMPKQSMDKGLAEKNESDAEPDASLLPRQDMTAEKNEDRSISSSAESAVDETWSVVSATTASSSGETVTLYTSAAEENGEIIWDDSQKWVLEISNGNGEYYTLYDQLVANGSVYYEVMQKESGDQLIYLYTVTATGTSVMQYTKTDSGYVEKNVCNSGSVNKLFSSIPDYE